MATQAQTYASPLAEVKMTESGDDFARLIHEPLRPTGDDARETIDTAVQTLAEMALAGQHLIKGKEEKDAVKSIAAMIAAIDKKIGEQLDEILHHDEFKVMEGAWRGLHHLVTKTETSEKLRIEFMNASKPELRKMFEKHPGASWDQSPLFKRIYSEEYGQLGGEPYGCLVGDYQFDESPKDMVVLNGMAKIAGAAHAPFITSPSPGLFGLQSWQQLPDLKDVSKKFTEPQYAGWRSFRNSEDSRYVALAMPRFLARLPYGAKTSPAEGIDYEEGAKEGSFKHYIWANSAYAMAANITRAFKEYGWTTRIRGAEAGGTVSGLPTHTFATADGGVDVKCPTELAINNQREGELAANGFMTLVHRKGTDEAVFIGGDSAHKPPKFDDPAITANAALGARLPYIFATSRFAHYLNAMMTDKIGSTAGMSSPAEIQRYLQEWIGNYVYDQPGASDELLAQRPLAGAEVKVEANPSRPGYYNAQFFLRPHYQLEGLTIGLRLVSELPSQRK